MEKHKKYTNIENLRKIHIYAKLTKFFYGSGNRRRTILIGVCLVLCVLVGTFVACHKETNLADDHWFNEGYYLKCDNGSDVIVVDAEGANSAFPCKMTAADDSVSFDGLTDGDRIKIEVFLIEETYPAHTKVYSIEKLSDGEIEDINPTVLDSLRDLGWIQNSVAIDKKYTELLSLTAYEIKQKYGELTLTYLENGGTPIVSVGSFDGIYLVYYDLMAPDFPNLDIPDELIADEVIFNHQYVDNPAFPGEICGLSIGNDISKANTQITWENADFHFINGTMFLDSTIGKYRLTAVVGAAHDPKMPNELTATDDDWTVWEKEFTKSPSGSIVQIRLEYAVSGEVDNLQKPNTSSIFNELDSEAIANLTFTPFDSTDVVLYHRFMASDTYIFLCTVHELNVDGTRSDAPPKDFAAYYTTDFGKTIGRVDIKLPDDLEYDTVMPAMFGPGGGSMELQIILRLTKGDETFYVSFDNFTYSGDSYLGFEYRGRLSDDKVETYKELQIGTTLQTVQPN